MRVVAGRALPFRNGIVLVTLPELPLTVAVVAEVRLFHGQRELRFIICMGSAMTGRASFLERLVHHPSLCHGGMTVQAFFFLSMKRINRYKENRDNTDKECQR